MPKPGSYEVRSVDGGRTVVIHLETVEREVIEAYEQHIDQLERQLIDARRENVRLMTLNAKGRAS